MQPINPQSTLSGPLRDYLSTPCQFLIGGESVPAKSGAVIDCLDPSSGKVIGSAFAASEADINMAVAAARTAFETPNWRTMAPAGRAERLHKLADLIRERGDDLLALEVLNQGNPVSSIGPWLISGLCDTLRYYAGWCTKIGGTTLNTSLSSANDEEACFGPAYHAFTNMEAVGVVGAIAPWNFPLVMAIGKIAPALAAGCTIVFKPAENTPLTALLLGDLFRQAGFPDGVVNIVNGYGHEAGAALAAHPDIDMVTFTGSTAIGKEIARSATGSLKKVSLELGGKSPVIVLADADINAAAANIAAGIFSNAGQTCTAGSRVFADKRVFDELMSKVTKIAKSLTIGPAYDPETELGPVVSQKQKNSVQDYIKTGIEEGCDLIVGGGDIDGPGFFVPPTVFVAKDQKPKICREEIFGPVLVASPVSSDLSEIATLANDSNYGLAASIWTQNLSAAHKLSNELHAGTVWVNCDNLFDEGLPFGGFKQSGQGKEGGMLGLSEYMQSKSVLMKL